MSRWRWAVVLVVMVGWLLMPGPTRAQSDVPSDAAIRMMQQIEDRGLVFETLVPAGGRLVHIYPIWADNIPLGLTEWRIGYFEVWRDCVGVVVAEGVTCRYVRLVPIGEIGRYRLLLVTLTDEGRAWIVSGS